MSRGFLLYKKSSKKCHFLNPVPVKNSTLAPLPAMVLFEKMAFGRLKGTFSIPKPIVLKIAGVEKLHPEPLFTAYGLG
jgi:hypothetical protein